MKGFLILVALMAADVSPPAQSLDQLGERTKLLLFELVPLGSSPEAVKFRILGLTRTGEGDLEGTFLDHPGSENVRVTFGFQEGRLVCISYVAGLRNSSRGAKLRLHQLFGKPYRKDPATGRGIAWCVKEMSNELGAFVMGVEMGEFVDSTGTWMGWRFKTGCSDSTSAD